MIKIEINDGDLLKLIVVLSAILFVVILFIWINRSKYSREYWDNGKIRCKSPKNKKKGRECYFYRNGRLNKVQFWKSNSLDGDSIVFYPTGEKYIKCFYIEGVLNGEYLVYNKNSELMYKAIYERGTKISEKYINVGNHKTHIKKTVSKKYRELYHYYKKEKFEIVKEEYLVIKEEEETRERLKKVNGFFSAVEKIAKNVSGVQAYSDRKSSIRLKDICTSYYNVAFSLLETSRTNTDKNVARFGVLRLSVLKNTTGRFLNYLSFMNQQNKEKQYEFLEGVGIDYANIQKMEKVDMVTSQAIKSTVAIGALGAMAAMGTPTLVMGTVSALATASTGTAISSLSGAAATNATLAWLGGGSLATGGGGMAVGATVLSTITVGATAGIGIIACGLMASAHYSKKLTEVKEYQKIVEENVAKIEQLLVLLHGVKRRIEELTNVTISLEERILQNLEFLEPLTVDFDFDNSYYVGVFQKNGILIKSINELTEVALFNELGELSKESYEIYVKTKTIVNKNIQN